MPPCSTSRRSKLRFLLGTWIGCQATHSHFLEPLSATVAVLPEILAWSLERPLWQQDALRRLVEQSTLTEQDIADVVTLCKAEVGLDADRAQPARGLAAAVGRDTDCGSPAVRLTCVHTVQNVNALRDDQALNISPAGLTIVYGDNGAGKSGYVRVLKQLCRARGARDAVHSNVYEDAAGPAAATVTYEVSDAPAGVSAAAEADSSAVSDPAPRAEVRNVTWSPGVRGPEELVQVSVFDSQSASVYVTEQNAVAYLPHGTDLFPKLVSVAEAVKSTLEQQVGEIDRAKDRFETISLGTAAYEVVSNLHVSLARERVDKLATITDADRARLSELRAEDRRLRADDPLATAKDLRRCASRVDEVRTRVEVLQSALGDAGIAGLKAARDGLDTARAAAELASERAFADAPIGGVGSSAWRALWFAARKFAEQRPIPARAYPVGPADDPRCVLCQQPLADDAAARMERFEEFVLGETQKQVDDAVQELQARVRTVEALDPDSVADKLLLEEIASLDQDLVAILNDCTQQLLIQRNGAVTAARASDAQTDWSTFVHAPTEVNTRLKKVSTQLTEKAIRYEADVDPNVQKRVTAAIQDLEARIALDAIRDRVYSEIERQRRKAALRLAVASTNTAAITRRNTEILTRAVTEPLADAFSEHIRALVLTHLPVVVTASGGEKGRAFHALTLDKKIAGRVPTNKVLSEGEHRGVALAAFLAEISLQDSASTVVFDDPVSSMDHGRREYVARRIVEIAKHRPVLVFTHDFVFLLLLQRTSEKYGGSIHPRYFRHDGQKAGLIADEWPWDGQTVKMRLGVLNRMIEGFPTLAVTDRPKYEEDVRIFYDRLRTTWERAVEEILFNDAIRRFGTEVQTKRLKNLHRLTEQQLLALDAGMTRASEWVQGHDHAAGLALPVPTPVEASADLDALDRWVKEVRKELQS